MSACGLLLALLREANSDLAWMLYSAENLLGGMRQGIDILEVNPPLGIWLLTPAAGVAKLTGFSSWPFWVLMTSAICLGSLFVAFPVINGLVSERQRNVLILIAGLAFLVLPRLDYSEREHLALALSLPYAVAAARRMTGLEVSCRRAAAIGLLGGIGFGLKPHFLIPLFLIEASILFRIGRQSLVRTEFLTLAGFGLLYLIAVLFLVPDYLLMALRLSPLYSTYLNNGILGAAKIGGLPLLFLLGAAAALYQKAQNRDELTVVFILAFVGFLAGALLQGKGFSYHYVAAWGYGLLFVARGVQVTWSELNWLPSGVVVRLSLGIILFKVLTVTTDSIRELFDRSNPKYRFTPAYHQVLAAVRQNAGPEGTVAVLASNPAGPWPLVLDAEARWYSRYMSLWPLVAIYDRQLWSRPYRLLEPRPFAERTGFEREFSEEIVRDLRRTRPQVLLVLVPDPDHPGWGAARRIDYLKYFGSVPGFRDFMAGYREAGTVGTFTMWLPAPPGAGP